MKRQALALVGVLSLLLATGSAFAQTIHVRANVPFDFSVGDTKLAAGEYDLSAVASGMTLSVRDASGKPQALRISNRIESLAPSEKTKLVFARYGDQYFLREVWIAGENTGQQLPKSSRENEVAMNRSVDQVIVMAKLR